jgi:cytochrome o ubiquinol oxidase subunit 2
MGPIGETERFVILTSIGLMLLVVIPVCVLTLLFARRYRAGNPKAVYMPKWHRSRPIELVVWAVPAIIVAVLGILLWEATYQLDPYKPIDVGVKPVRVEVVSLDWKWLFIYPEEGIATVNQLVFPAGVPLSLRVTSDTVMTSFFIPQLGSQIYAMAGMQTRLHLMARQPGVFRGQNQQFSGRGYADMIFKATAVPRKEFQEWVQKIRQSPEKLDQARFAKLEVPGADYPVTIFSSVTPGLFDAILNKYRKSGTRHPGGQTGVRPAVPLKTGGSEGE